MNNILKPYESFLMNMENVYIFGTQKLGTRAFDSFTKYGKASVKGFIDNNPELTSFKGLKVYRPEELVESKDRINVIIASINYVHEMETQLKELGFENIIHYPVLSLFDNETFHPEPVYDGLYDEYVEHEKEYDEIRKLFNDEKSLQVFDKIIEYRKTYSTSIYPEIKDKQAYFEAFLPNEKVFVDGGAFDGVTSKEYSEFVGGEYEKIYVIEPDSASMCLTKENLNAYKNIEYIEAGLSDSHKFLKFDSRGDTGSLFCEDGTDVIECCTLDKIVKEEKAFIKLDIEGAETEALLGAKRLIQNGSTLAICVYHRPCDLRTIPTLIKSMNPKYKFYLRHYWACIFETVLYAVCEND